MRVLLPDERDVLMPFMEDKIPELITSIEDFNAVIVLLSPRQKTIFLRASKARLVALVLEGVEIANFNTLRNIVLRAVQFMWNFHEALQSVPPEEHTQFEALRRFPEHLRAALKNLTDEETKMLIDELKTRVPAEFNLEEMIAVCRPEVSTKQSQKRSFEETVDAAAEEDAVRRMRL